MWLAFSEEISTGKASTRDKGEVYDVAVDMRKDFPTLGQWYGVLFSEENKKKFIIPKNFAHGFFVLSDYAEFAINVPISTIQTMRADWLTTTLRLVSTGQFQREWSLLGLKRI